MKINRHQHKFVSPTHCETCGMPVGGWPIRTYTSANTGTYTEAPRQMGVERFYGCAGPCCDAVPLDEYPARMQAHVLTARTCRRKGLTCEQPSRLRETGSWQG